MKRKVAIIGGGIAGLSAAIVLQSRCAVVLHKLSGAAVATSLSSGLWNTAQEFILLGDDVACERISHAAYLNFSGQMIASPPALCTNPQDGPSLGFFMNQDLIGSLEKRLFCPVVEGVADEEELQQQYDVVIVASGAATMSRGYAVFRGLSPRPANFISFQTWSNGRRFAAVPVPNNMCQWFAATQQPFGGDGMGMLEAPFSNGSRKASVDDVINQFKGFHWPIPHLIEATIGSPVVSSGWSSPLPKMLPMDSKNNIVRIGDAFQVLDPILAVGASVAVEEAILLRKVLGDESLSWYDFERIRRHRRLKMDRVSWVVNTLSQAPLDLGARMMSACPARLSTFVLKGVIEDLAQVKFRC